MDNYDNNDLLPDDQRPNVISISIAVGFLFLILMVRLFYLQISTFDDYSRESEENRITQKREKATRGLITDRNSQILARNRPFYTVSVARTSHEDFAEIKRAFISALGDTSTDGKYNRRLRSIRLKRDVDFRTVSIVEEQLRTHHPLLFIEIEAQRFYPFGNIAAHVIGYMGILPNQNLEQTKYNQYVAGDFIGKTGIEKLYENELRGLDGVKYFEVDASGNVRREFTRRRQPPNPGETLQLTIDIELQKAVEQALPDSLPGTAIVLDVDTGAILAMANNPTFDPNIFVSFQSQKERIDVINSETTLLNRAIRGRYPPGSTLKMIGAIAALETGVTDTMSTFTACVGSLQVGDVIFRCNQRSGHGELSLLSALETSCNTYFHHLAHLITIEEWREWAEKFGLGQPTGLTFSPNEAAGLLPSRTYYQKRGGWTLGHLLNLIIGQGAVLTTPLQMTRLVAAIANGGYLITPHLTGTVKPSKKIKGLTETTLKTIKRAMLNVVYGALGTGSLAATDGVIVAGKTGTAQVPNRTNESNDAWFVGFSPYAKPEIALAIVVEGGGGGGTTAAPIAKQIFSAYHNPINLDRSRDLSFNE